MSVLISFSVYFLNCFLFFFFLSFFPVLIITSRFCSLIHPMMKEITLEFTSDLYDDMQRNRLCWKWLLKWASNVTYWWFLCVHKESSLFISCLFLPFWIIYLIQFYAQTNRKESSRFSKATARTYFSIWITRLFTCSKQDCDCFLWRGY